MGTQLPRAEGLSFADCSGSGEFQHQRLRRQPSPPPAPQPSARLPLVTHDVQLSPALSEIPHFVEARAENLLPES